MRALGTAILVGVFFTPFIGAQSWKDRIPKPDPMKFHSVRDAKEWKNPYLIVRPDGIAIIGRTPSGQAISVESVHAELERLPKAAWPYGLIVAVQDTSILDSQDDMKSVDAQRTKLLMLLKEMGVAVDRWP
jgi:hypothetical protein